MDTLRHLNPAHALAILQAVLVFLLKSSLCFAAIALLVRLTTSPARRFAFWLAYLVGTALYAVSDAITLVANLRTQPATLPHPEQSAWSHIESHLEPHTLHIAAWTIPEVLAAHITTAVFVLALGYITFVVAALLLHKRRQSSLRRALLFAFDPSVPLSNLFDSLASRLRIHDSQLLILPGIDSPATVGWLKPLILLPALCDATPEDALDPQQTTQTSDILLHELHHIRRRDWLIDHVAHAIRALLFFQPAVWIACRHLREEREFACDQAVIGNQPEMRVRYAESLVRFARFTSRAGDSPATAYGVDFAAATGHLATRVNAILKPPAEAIGPRGSFEWMARSFARSLAGTALLVGLLFGLSSLTLTLALPVVIHAVTTPLAASSILPRITRHRRLATHPELHALHSPELPTPPPSHSSAVVTHLKSDSTAPWMIAAMASSDNHPERVRVKLEPAADTPDEPLPGAGGPLTSSTPTSAGGPSIGASNNLSAFGRVPLGSSSHNGTSAIGTNPIAHVPVSRGHH